MLKIASVMSFETTSVKLYKTFRGLVAGHSVINT